jgi:hypothetical protein
MLIKSNISWQFFILKFFFLGSIASRGVLLGKSINIKKYIHLVNNIAHSKNVDAKVT